MYTVQFEEMKIVIATSVTRSTVLDLSGKTLEALVFPDITGTALTFEAALPNTQGDSTLVGSTWVPIVDAAGSTYGLTIADNTHQVVDRDVFTGVRFLRLNFTTNQVADLTVKAACGRAL